jgi:hypothetical protein
MNAAQPTMKYSELIACALQRECEIGHVALKTVQIIWAGRDHCSEYKLGPDGLWHHSRPVGMPKFQ